MHNSHKQARGKKRDVSRRTMSFLLSSEEGGRPRAAPWWFRMPGDASAVLQGAEILQSFTRWWDMSITPPLPQFSLSFVSCPRLH